MYDPTIGQFLSEDPIGFDALDPNLRRYVLNQPAMLTDPTGLSPNKGASFPLLPEKVELKDEFAKKLYDSLICSADGRALLVAAHLAFVRSGRGKHLTIQEGPTQIDYATGTISVSNWGTEKNPKPMISMPAFLQELSNMAHLAEFAELEALARAGKSNAAEWAVKKERVEFEALWEVAEIKHRVLSKGEDCLGMLNAEPLGRDWLSMGKENAWKFYLNP